MGKLRCNKVIILSIVTIVVATLMASCSLLKLYDKEWIIGKSAEEIIERYGEFDIGTPREDGSYSKGAYMTKEKRVGFLGVLGWIVSILAASVAFYCAVGLGASVALRKRGKSKLSFIV